jgi:hypothetical protein
MIKLVKGDDVKLVDPNSALFQRLADDGWKGDGVPVPELALVPEPKSKKVNK